MLAAALFGLIAPGTTSNCPVTGLNACVAVVSPCGWPIAIVAMVAEVAAFCSACLRAFMFDRSVSGLKAAATGTPPFMKVRMSFLNSLAVA